MITHHTRKSFKFPACIARRARIFQSYIFYSYIFLFAFMIPAIREAMECMQ